MSSKELTERSQDIPAKDVEEVSMPSPTSPEIVEKVCNLIRKGIDLQTACAAEMVNYKTFIDHLVKGMNDAAEFKSSPSVNLYVSVKKATAERYIHLNDFIEDSLNDDPRFVYKLLYLYSSRGFKTPSSMFDVMIIAESNDLRRKIIEQEKLSTQEMEEKLKNVLKKQHFDEMRPLMEN
jgi:hypothetical protein